MRAIFPSLTTTDYWGLLLRKLPRGVVWAQQAIRSGAAYLDGVPVPLTYFSRYLMGMADELARVHARLIALPPESVPATTSELLAEWETCVGLPEFGYTPPTTADRRLALAGKLAAKGGASAAYFEGLAIAYDAVSVDVSDGPWTFWWTVSLPSDVTRACCTSSCDAALVEFTTEAGERIAGAFTHYKPAHTMIFWDGGIAP